jgi:hypothetical protein
MIKTFSVLLVGFLFINCRKKDQPEVIAPLPFESIPVIVPVAPGIFDEVSGIADSKTVPGNIWMQQDGGNPAELFLLSYNGTVQKRIPFKSVVNRDWEDMASGKGPIPGINYLYIAETGDNNLTSLNYSIYRFEEPSAITDTIKSVDKINFQYPDGPHNAEALFISNAKDIYIITKNDEKSKIYKLPFPQNTNAIITATFVGKLSFTGVTGAASSNDGTELLLKTYTNVYYWKLTGSELPETVMQKTPLTLGYALEAQGESLCFKQDKSGFFTLSEKPFFVTAVTLNFYKRK